METRFEKKGMKIEGGQFGKKGTSGRKDEERVMEG
jgi:hypothetical protein